MKLSGAHWYTRRKKTRAFGGGQKPKNPTSLRNLRKTPFLWSLEKAKAGIDIRHRVLFPFPNPSLSSPIAFASRKKRMDRDGGPAASPYGDGAGAGAGGKFQRRPYRRPTPYDRPPLPTTAAGAPHRKEGWLSKIATGASRFLPSLSSRTPPPLLPSQSDQGRLPLLSPGVGFIASDFLLGFLEIGNGLARI
ncbi:hypothetical protein ACLOJK_020190 [Asimina triloba]